MNALIFISRLPMPVASYQCNSARTYRLMKPNFCETFSLAPPPPAIAFAQAPTFPKTRSCRDCLNTAYVANDFEVHSATVSERGTTVNANCRYN